MRPFLSDGELCCKTAAPQHAASGAPQSNFLTAELRSKDCTNKPELNTHQEKVKHSQEAWKNGGEVVQPSSWTIINLPIDLARGLLLGQACRG